MSEIMILQKKNKSLDELFGMSLVDICKSILIIFLLFEIVAWSFSYDQMMDAINNGILTHLVQTFKVVLLPETFSFIIFVRYIDFWRKYIVFDPNENNIRNFWMYQAKLLPVFLIAYWVFAPVSFSIRFLINTDLYQLTWANLWGYYQETLFKGYMYSLYLFFIIIIGYTRVNIKLLTPLFDFNPTLPQEQKNDTPVFEEEVIENFQEPINQILDTPITETIETEEPAKQYKDIIMGRDVRGEVILYCTDIYYFERDERQQVSYGKKGRVLINKTINAIQEELDPALFFRANRSVIVNLQYLNGYSYYGDNKYILYLDTPKKDEVFMQQKNIKLLREALQKYEASYNPTVKAYGSSADELTPNTPSVSTLEELH
jgi:LytTr DNA-binding domain